MTAEAVPELRPASELAAQIQGKSESEPIAEDDPKSQLEYSFQFDHVDPRGKRWSGEFRNKILTQGEKIQVEVLRARLSGNTPIEALGTDGWWQSRLIAHMTLSLVKRPEWAKELGEFYDPEIISKLWEEVDSHEARFHRRESDSRVGKGGPKDGDG